MFGVCRHDAGGGTGCHNLIYFESITQKVLISPFCFLYFLKKADVCWCKVAQVFPLTLGESQAERERKSCQERG